MKTHQKAAEFFHWKSHRARAGTRALLAFVTLCLSGPEVRAESDNSVRTRVVAWGNTWGSVPAELTNAVQISAGDVVGMAVTSDQRLVDRKSVV